MDFRSPFFHLTLCNRVILFFSTTSTTVMISKGLERGCLCGNSCAVVSPPPCPTFG